MNQTQLTPPLSAPNVTCCFFQLTQQNTDLTLIFPPNFFFLSLSHPFPSHLVASNLLSTTSTSQTWPKKHNVPNKKKPLGKITSNSQKQSTITPPWGMSICMWHCLFLGTTFLPQCTFPLGILNFPTILFSIFLKRKYMSLKELCALAREMKLILDPNGFTHIPTWPLFQIFHGFQGLIFHQRFCYHTPQWFSSQSLHFSNNVSNSISQWTLDVAFTRTISSIHWRRIKSGMMA